MIRKSLLVAGLVLAAGVSVPPLRAQDTSPRTVHVDIKSFKFDPATIEVRPGDIVEWANRDLAPHTATSDTGDWDTGPLKGGKSGQVRATVAGTFSYHCTFHPQMTGRITVVAP